VSRQGRSSSHGAFLSFQTLFLFSFDHDRSPARSRLLFVLLHLDAGGQKTFYYYLTDQVGSVMQVIREDGTVVNRYDYDAFGNAVAANTSEQVENRYRFQGREYDAHRGDYYFRNRTYIPEWGVFTGPDALVQIEANGPCNYLFANNNPLRFRDPEGLLPGVGDELGVGFGGHILTPSLSDPVRARVIIRGPGGGVVTESAVKDPFSGAWVTGSYLQTNYETRVHTHKMPREKAMLEIVCDGPGGTWAKLRWLELARIDPETAGISKKWQPFIILSAAFVSSGVTPPLPDGQPKGLRGPRVSVAKAGGEAKRGAPKVHGNSRASTKAQHGYEVVDTQSGKAVKTGISSEKMTKAGGSYRANSQANRWNREAGQPGRYEGRVKTDIPEGTGARQKALEWEAQNAQRLREAGELADPTKHVRP
jgi:RHS repeat-associated protein